MGYVLGEDDVILLVMPPWHSGKYDQYEIVLKDSNKVVGNISFFYDSNKITGNVEYFIFYEHRGKGYAKRALKVLAENIYKLDETDLFISILPDNKASIKLALSCGAVLHKKVEIPKKHSFSKDGKYKYANMYIIKYKGENNEKNKSK